MIKAAVKIIRMKCSLHAFGRSEGVILVCIVYTFFSFVWLMCLWVRRDKGMARPLACEW